MMLIFLNSAISGSLALFLKMVNPSLNMSQPGGIEALSFLLETATAKLLIFGLLAAS